MLSVLRATGLQANTATRLTTSDRYSRAFQERQQHAAGKQPETGLALVYANTKRKFNRSFDWIMDKYTSLEFWLNTEYPKGHVIIFYLITIANAALYVVDVITDAFVVKDLFNAELNAYAGFVLMFMLGHYAVVAFLLATKWYYLFEEHILRRIDRLHFGKAAPEADDADQDLSSKQRVHGHRAHHPSLLARLLTWLMQSMLKLLALVAYCIVLLPAVPVLDFAMMAGDLMTGLFKTPGESRDSAMRARNFLLQYVTVRIPFQCIFESVPQTAFQVFLYFKLSGDSQFSISMQNLIQSIAVSFANVTKNAFDIYVAYKVSGFSFMYYMKNALEFEGAATLPFYWNSRRSSLADRLVLAGDFHTLAHAQKMKMFQAALTRRSITITDSLEANTADECVIHASSWLMLRFIADNLPVSLNEEESSSTIRLDLDNIFRLPLRDDTRFLSRPKGRKMVMAVRSSLFEFLNHSNIWINLDTVRLAGCGVHGEEVDAVGEMLVRSRVRDLDLSSNPLGDMGLAALCEGLMSNTSLVSLRLAHVRITESGAYHLLQGLAEHESLAHLDVSYNHLHSAGVQHVAELLSSLPRLSSLALAASGSGATGITAICQEAGFCSGLTSLVLSSHACMGQAIGEVADLLDRAPNLASLALAHCDLRAEAVSALCTALSRSTGITSLDLSGNPLVDAQVSSLASGLAARPAGSKLSELLLGECGLDEYGAGQLCAAIKSPGLVSLDLSGSSPGSEQLHELMEGQRATMESLKLVGCGLSGSWLGRGRVAHTMGLLVELDLSHNPLGEVGVGLLCREVLEAATTPSLQTLRLCSANVGASAFDALLDALAINSSLVKLYLSHNLIGAFDTAKCAHFHASNRKLALLDLRSNRLSKAWCSELLAVTGTGFARLVML